MTPPPPKANLTRLSIEPSIPLILAGHVLQQRRGDMAYEFTQEANFLFLTGISEPGWRCVVLEGRMTLIAPKTDKVRALFDGELSFEAAKQTSGADEVLTYREGQAYMKMLAHAHNTAQVLGADPHERFYGATPNPGPARLRRRVMSLFGETKDVRSAFSKARAIKQPHEIAELRRVTARTCEAFEKVKQELSTYTYEYEVEAAYTQAFRSHNMQHAYTPIVAGGINACTLHYVENKGPLPKRGLVLIDIGATAGTMNADITRTYAVGRSTSREREVYDAVLRAQRAIIALIKPGVSFRQYQEESDDIMKEALASVGLLQKESDFRRYFPHAVSHGLGIDVHESLGGYDTFQPGMVLTVEPGIYIPEEAIGVRIEDDILVTQDGHENLSRSLATAL